MKPEKLILSAFGSYAGRTEIDFTVQTGGLFPVSYTHLTLPTNSLV